MQATASDGLPKQQPRKSKFDLFHLRSLSLGKPGSKIGQVIRARAEIEAGLASGMALREVWQAAVKDGIEVSYAQFRVYVSRIRRRRQQSRGLDPQPPAAPPGTESNTEAPPIHDPFRNLREQEEKKRRSGFEYDPFSINKDLI